jgi:hypothetical protein
MPLAPDGIFRSEAFLAAQEARASLEQAELGVAAAQAIVAEHAAEVARLDEIEAERLLTLAQKADRGKVQAARNRVSTMRTLAAEIETEAAALASSWAKLADEAEGVSALHPDSPPVEVKLPQRLNDGRVVMVTEMRPGPDHRAIAASRLRDLVIAEFSRHGLPGVAYSGVVDTLTETIAAFGREAVENLSDALGIRPRERAVVEHMPADAPGAPAP